MRILIIEKRLEIATLLQRRLEKEYYAVDVSTEISSGYKLSGAEDYDLILLTKAFPREDKFTFVRNLRVNKVWIPVIAFVKRNRPNRRLALLKEGCDLCITTPFNFVELVSHMRALLRRSVVQKDRYLKYGDLIIDSCGRTAFYKGELFPFRNKEFDLLRYFIMNEGFLITKEMIKEKIWHSENCSFSNTVDVHLTYLRESLQKMNIRIKTIRGIGYKLEILL